MPSNSGRSDGSTSNQSTQGSRDDRTDDAKFGSNAPSYRASPPDSTIGFTIRPRASPINPEIPPPAYERNPPTQSERPLRPRFDYAFTLSTDDTDSDSVANLLASDGGSQAGGRDGHVFHNMGGTLGRSSRGSHRSPGGSIQSAPHRRDPPRVGEDAFEFTGPAQHSPNPDGDLVSAIHSEDTETVISLKTVTEDYALRFAAYCLQTARTFLRTNSPQALEQIFRTDPRRREITSNSPLTDLLLRMQAVIKATPHLPRTLAPVPPTERPVSRLFDEVKHIITSLADLPQTRYDDGPTRAKVAALFPTDAAMPFWDVATQRWLLKRAFREITDKFPGQQGNPKDPVELVLCCSQYAKVICWAHIIMTMYIQAGASDSLVTTPTPTSAPTASSSGASRPPPSNSRASEQMGQKSPTRKSIDITINLTESPLGTTYELKNNTFASQALQTALTKMRLGPSADHYILLTESSDPLSEIHPWSFAWDALADASKKDLDATSDALALYVAPIGPTIEARLRKVEDLARRIEDRMHGMALSERKRARFTAYRRALVEMAGGEVGMSEYLSVTAFRQELVEFAELSLKIKEK